MSQLSSTFQYCASCSWCLQVYWFGVDGVVDQLEDSPQALRTILRAVLKVNFTTATLSVINHT